MRPNNITDLRIEVTNQTAEAAAAAGLIAGMYRDWADKRGKLLAEGVGESYHMIIGGIKEARKLAHEGGLHRVTKRHETSGLRHTAWVKVVVNDRETEEEVRQYTLHPYSLVRDLRTGKEVADVTAVLDGNLELLWGRT